jgi:3-(3-hydroxy-phenyl)propionate hydroxylase
VAVRSRCAPDEVGSPLPKEPSGTLIQDLENTLHFWFQEKRVDWVLIRPDRFIAAVGSRHDAVNELSAFCDAVLAP